ncbi:RDD family protein [Oligoflexia bacterium]|nr:RDD family protein [Oligoflexia bacterium]
MRAGFLSRSIAAVIDSFFYFAICAIAGYFLAIIMGIESLDQFALDAETLKVELSQDMQRAIKLLAPGFYLELICLMIAPIYCLTEVVGAATPGKVICGLRIGRKDGRSAEWPDLLRRYFVWEAVSFTCVFLKLTLFATLLSGSMRAFAAGTLIYGLGMLIVGLYCIVLIVGLIGACFENRLCLHDNLSGTAVYSKKRWVPGIIETEDRFGRPLIDQPPPPRNPDAVTKLLFK